MRRLILTTLGAAGLVCVAPTVAHAHNFAYQTGCSGITWSANAYQAEQTNSIVVTIDGTVAYTDSSFGTTDSGTRTWSPTAAHTWSIVVDAPGTEFDHSPRGTQQPCQTSSTTTTSSTTSTTTPPSTTTIPPTTTLGPETTTSTPSTTTTTTIVAVGDAPVPTTTTPIPPTDPPTSAAAEPLDQLPITGGDSTILAVAGLVFAVGAVLVVLTRRRST